MPFEVLLTEDARRDITRQDLERTEDEERDEPEREDGEQQALQNQPGDIHGLKLAQADLEGSKIFLRTWRTEEQRQHRCAADRSSAQMHQLPHLIVV